MRIRKAFWIWGEFSKEGTTYLNSLKKKVQEKIISPDFDIHLTLAGPYKTFDKSFIEALDSSILPKTKLKLQLKKIEYSNQFYKSLYISVKETRNLTNLRSIIYKLNPYYVSQEYKPHISLSYGQHNKKDKKIIIENTILKLDFIIMDKISLVYVDEQKEIWDIRQSFFL